MIGPAVGSARDGTEYVQSCTTQIIQAACNVIVPPGSLNPFIAGSVPTSDLRQFESDTVQAYLAWHGLPSTDASLIYQYGRSDLRSELVRAAAAGRLMTIVFKPASDRTANEQAVYSWFQFQVAAIRTDSVAGGGPDRNAWQANPARGRPIRISPRRTGCSIAARSSAIRRTPSVKSSTLRHQCLRSAIFQTAALKKVYGGVLTNNSNGTAIQTMTTISSSEILGIAAGAGAVGGAATGTGLLLPIGAAAIAPYSVGLASEVVGWPPAWRQGPSPSQCHSS